jgi:hypothetical protein
MPLIPIAMALAQFAPQIANMLGGSKAEAVAEHVVSVARAVTGADTPEEALAQIRQNGELAMAFQTKLVEANVELERIHSDTTIKLAESDAGDRKDARGMQIATRSRAPGVLAVVITVGFFGVLGLMLTGTFKPADNQALLILLGALGAGFGQVLNFYFGSSHGSQQKTDLLAKSQPIK